MNPGAMRTVRSSSAARPSDLNAKVLAGKLQLQVASDGPRFGQGCRRVTLGGEVGQYQSAHADTLCDPPGLAGVEVPFPLLAALERRLAQEHIGTPGQAIEVGSGAGIGLVGEDVTAVLHAYPQGFGRV